MKYFDNHSDGKRGNGKRTKGKGRTLGALPIPKPLFSGKRERELLPEPPEAGMDRTWEPKDSLYQPPAIFSANSGSSKRRRRNGDTGANRQRNGVFAKYGSVDIEISNLFYQLKQEGEKLKLLPYEKLDAYLTQALTLADNKTLMRTHTLLQQCLAKLEQAIIARYECYDRMIEITQKRGDKKEFLECLQGRLDCVIHLLTIQDKGCLSQSGEKVLKLYGTTTGPITCDI